MKENAKRESPLFKVTKRLSLQVLLTENIERGSQSLKVTEPLKL